MDSTDALVHLLPINLNAYRLFYVAYSLHLAQKKRGLCCLHAKQLTSIHLMSFAMPIALGPL